MTEIYFTRHGESRANADGVIAGWHDSPLTEKGIRQAHDEATRIHAEGIRFDTILSSPLSRAYDTAAAIAEANGFSAEDIIVIDDLREKGAGDFEGKPIHELYDATNEERVQAGAESFDGFAVRVQRANAEIAKYALGTTLIVGHAGFYRMTRCLAQGLPPSEMVHMEKPANGTLIEYPRSLTFPVL